MGFRVEGSGFRVWGLGEVVAEPQTPSLTHVDASGFRVLGFSGFLGFRVQGLGFRV